jgi:two-component system, OmpR family, sensor kinase
MRSLFLRIFLALWVTTTVIGAAFAVIHANSFPAERIARWQRLLAETVRLHGEQSLRCLETATRSRCEEELRQLADDTDLTLFVFRDQEVLLATIDVPEAARSVVRDVSADGREARSESKAGSFLGVRITSEDREGYVVVGRRPHMSRWDRIISPQTLPLRLLILTVLTGAASYLLARYLTRPLRALRRATQQIADGDFAVRVGPEIGVNVDEVASLGQDFDRMAARIETLRATEQRLLRDISHELRSPLARLRVALEMARQRAGDGATKHLDRIEREAERLGDLIGQVLTVARLESELQERPLEDEIDVVAIVTEVVRDADFEARAHNRRVELHTEVSAHLLGSEEILRSAIENVLRNAVRMTSEESPVEVTLRSVPGAERIELLVRDHGPGVPDSALRDIFRPFYRVGTDRDRRTGGSGIGLAITQRAVELHGGSVSAENDPGGGLLVTLTLPVIAVRSSLPPDPARVEGEAPPTPADARDTRTESRLHS